VIGEMVYPKGCSRKMQQSFGFKVQAIRVVDGESCFVDNEDHYEPIKHCTTKLSQ
jgi:hypothetical protein